MTKQELRRAVAWARKSHLSWARYQERRRRAGKPCIQHAGSATHHRRWVRIYDSLAEALK